MTLFAHCYDSNGYFTHTEPCQRDPLESARLDRDVWLMPANACTDAPEFASGKIPRRVHDAWRLEEDHKGEEGYLNGQPHTVTEYGPLPDGWSNEPPAPATKDLFTRLRAIRDARLGVTDKYMLTDYPVSAEALALIKTYRATLRSLPEQPGAPWDGGGESTPWPPKPQTTAGNLACV